MVAIEAISELVLALGADAAINSADRITAAARVVALRGLSEDDVHRAADYLAQDEEFGRAVSRFKKAIIAQDFTDALKQCAPPPAPHWKQQGFASEAEWAAAAAEASEAWHHQVAEAQAPLRLLAESNRPMTVPLAAAPSEVLVGPACPVHGRELVDGTFCAACAVDEAMNMRRRGVRPADPSADTSAEAEL